MYHSLEIRNLEVSYLVKKQENAAIKGLNCVFSNEMNIIVGSSGSGKTTLLRAIAHSLEYNGDILVDGENILKKSKKELNISYLSQNFILYPHLSIFENIAFPLKNQKLDEEVIYERVYDLANFFEILPCLSRLPKHLSIGQQQRVALARALVKVPDILLLDEPFSNADAKFKEEYILLLKKIVEHNNILTIFVTHDIKDAIQVGDTFFEMEEGTISKPLTKEEMINIYKDYIE